jgi:hypothetical protein
MNGRDNRISAEAHVVSTVLISDDEQNVRLALGYRRHVPILRRTRPRDVSRPPRFTL